MTEKEKAEAYDEAIERAKKLYGNGIIEEIFPELKESKDKKIREAILKGLIDCRDAPDLGWSNFGGIHIDDCIAWLEKQGEQKPTLPKWKYKKDNTPLLRDSIILNKYGGVAKSPSGAIVSDAWVLDYDELAKLPKEENIEPKFKVGDWVVNKFGDSWHIDSLDKKNYQVSDGKGNYNYFPISKQDEIHLWTIQDAKDGDVIFYDEGWICIFKCIHGIWYSSYCFITDDGEFHTGYERHAVDSTIHGNAHPATKEHRDILMKAMKDAGYEWDSEKKELKKLVEPKFKVGDKITNSFRKYVGASGSQVIISEITEDKYIFTDGSYIFISNQDSWELAPDKNPKFDPKTLKQFDKVLVRNFPVSIWQCGIFSHQHFHQYFVYNDTYKFCIPYNEETKHLVGTTDEAPKYYRYWED